MNHYDKIIRPVWAEIDLQALRHNLHEVRRLVGPEVEIMAVVKAEAYGHGAVKVAQTAIENGASWLGVSLPEEGIVLRKAGFTVPILVFEALQPEQVDAFIDYDLTATVCILDSAIALSRAALKAGKTAALHVKVDTGMGRVGVCYSDALKIVKGIAKLPAIQTTGIYSHLATADQENKDFANLQIKRFTKVVSELREAGLLPGKVHLANSAAIIDLPASYFNMVRPGIMLYGMKPSSEMSLSGKVDLQPVLSLKTKVIFVKRVPAQTGISYGHCYRTKKETTIVTIPIGYGDGWSRRLTNQAEAIIGGKKYPVVGAICMDQCMIDVGDDPVELGASVTLIGKDGEAEITVDSIAETLGTINYEITCMLGSRVPRVYKS
ncbi:MAG TPA: alanine racemase [Bacillota bacterium]|nr:alanine racemase [Bacillota bacterium]